MSGAATRPRAEIVTLPEIPNGHPRSRVGCSPALFSIAEPEACVLRFWEHVPGKVVVFEVRVNSLAQSDPKAVSAIVTWVALINPEFELGADSERMWLEWVADLPEASWDG